MSLVFVENGIDREGKIWYTNEAVASGGPVSYTHLDVYKRQINELWQQDVPLAGCRVAANILEQEDSVCPRKFVMAW